VTGLERRVGTALVYGVIVLSAIFAPPPTFVALVAILAALGYLELRALFKYRPYQPWLIGVVFTVLFVIAHMVQSVWTDGLLAMTIALCAAFGVVAILVFVAEGARHRPSPAVAGGVFTLGGALYLGLLFGYLVDLWMAGGAATKGYLGTLPVWLALAFVPTWAADITAYFVGSSIGRRRIAPQISPKKTWKGRSRASPPPRSSHFSSRRPRASGPDRRCSSRRSSARWDSRAICSNPRSSEPRARKTPARCCPGTAGCSTASTASYSSHRSSRWPWRWLWGWDDGRVVTRLAILGVTGSIGRQALDVVGSHPDRLRVTAIASARNASELETIATQTGASATVLQERDGDDALCDLATRADVDLVLVATPGIAGLAPTLAALRAGKRVALANKEVLVTAVTSSRRSPGERGTAFGRWTASTARSGSAWSASGWRASRASPSPHRAGHSASGHSTSSRR
jgi:hypothetical protein